MKSKIAVWLTVGLLVAVTYGYSQDQQAYINESNQVRLAPRLLNYQGFITDTLGIPITNPAVSVTFGIWTSSGGGTQLWYETQPISVVKGIFSVILGNLTPIPDSVFTKGSDRWLELTYAGITLSPRTRIVSSAYAYTSAYADTASYARLLQGKDTIALDARYVNEGQANSIFTPMIIDTAVTMAKLAPAGAAANQVIKWTGSAWQPGTDIVGADADWTYLVSDIADTTLQMGGRWGLARPGNVLYGNADSTHVNFGVACTTGASGENNKYCTIGGGKFNTAGEWYTTVAGGYNNVAESSYATVAGGYNNSATGIRSTIGGGYGNTAGKSATTVAGGYSNAADSNYATVGGGEFNVASNSYATVAGGYINTASGIRSTIGGGYSNTASKTATTVAGGNSNAADSNYATVGGGYDNTAHGYSSVISGGCYNLINDSYATICGGARDSVKVPYGAILGGYSNLAGDASDDTAAVVVAGLNNSATARYAYVGGGRDNIAMDECNTVGGGHNNNVSGLDATISGGSNNIANSNFATVSGGNSNLAGNAATVGGGVGNIATGSSATIAGGLTNHASGGAAIGGGYNNVASGGYSAVPGGQSDSSAAFCSFATNFSTTVSSGHDYSAAFTSSHTLAASQVRAAAFSTGFMDFAMDHPGDPMNKILNQYAVGSDEVMLMYSGSVLLDAEGRAVVDLPDYFDDINRDPRIQLTGVGSSDVVYVAEDVRGNSFVIGGKPGMKVYWQVTAERKDIHAEIARINTPVMQEKTGDLRNHSIDDDAMIGMYDDLKQKNPELFKFKTEEGRRVHEQAKKMIEGKE